VPEAHLAQARLLEEIVTAPVGRPITVSRSTGKEIAASLGQWLIYLLLVSAMVIVAFVPDLQELVRPPSQPEAKAFHNVVQGLAPGSDVLLVFDYDASLDGELTPQARVIAWHLLNKDLGLVAVSLTPQGAAIAQDIIASDTPRLADPTRRVAGTDYVNLGYLPPHPASLHAFMRSPLDGTVPWAVGTLDAADTALGQGVQRFDDLDLIVVISGNQEHVRWWIEQVGSQKPVRILAGVSASIAPYLQPYVGQAGSGQLDGMLVGLAGAAEYERLSGASFTPNARQNLTLQGYAQLVLAGVILFGGVLGIVKRK